MGHHRRRCSGTLGTFSSFSRNVAWAVGSSAAGMSAADLAVEVAEDVFLLLLDMWLLWWLLLLVAQVGLLVLVVVVIGGTGIHSAALRRCGPLAASVEEVTLMFEGMSTVTNVATRLLHGPPWEGCLSRKPTRVGQRCQYVPHHREGHL